MNAEFEELRKLVGRFEARVAKLEAVILSKPTEESKPPAGRKLSVKELLRSMKAQTDVHKTLAIGYYLEKYEGMSSFNVGDVINGFRAAKEPLPSNTHAFVNQNIKNAHVMEACEKKDNKKAYVLTASGETFVENGFKEN